MILSRASRTDKSLNDERLPQKGHYRPEERDREIYRPPASGRFPTWVAQLDFLPAKGHFFSFLVRRELKSTKHFPEPGLNDESEKNRIYRYQLSR